MNKSLPIPVGLCLLALSTQAQQKTDSLRRQQLKEIAVMEKKRSMKTDSMSPVLRMEGRLLEIPQNITGVSSDLMREQGAIEMKDIVRNASGVKMGYNSSLFDASATVMMRGFSAETYVNGMPQRSTMGALTEDAAFIERVDFIKGPAGFLISSGDPGGSINITTKTPRQQRIRHAEIAGGSFGFMRAAADIGSAVKSKGVSYRLNGAYQGSQSFQDFISTKKYVLAPVVQYNFSRRTYLLAEYNLIDMRADGGSSVTRLGTAGEVLKDRMADNYAGDPNLPQSGSSSQSARIAFEHRFNDNLRLTVQSKYTVNTTDVWYLISDNYSLVNFDSTNVTRRLPVNNSITGRVAAVQAYLSGSFRTGHHVVHNIVGGMDYNYSKDNYTNAYGQHTFTFDKNRPQYGLDRDSVKMLGKATLIARENNWTSAFVYSTSRIHTNWLFNFGGRFTINTPVTTNARQPQKDETAFSPRLGITRLLKGNLAVYALYDQSFIPQSGVDASGQRFDPQRGNSIEAGAKKEWFQQKLITSIAGYKIIKNNLLVSDLEHPGFRRQIGQATSTGAEVDIMGRISNRLSVSANYSYTHAITSKDTRKENEGNKLAFTPEQVINSWAQYTLPLTDLSQIRCSVGHTTVTKTATYTPGFDLKGYTKFDAGIAYTHGKWYVRVVADNLTNKRYFSSGDMLTGSVYEGVSSYYYIEGAPVSFKAFAGIRL
ncbi:TonB-dependent siderophore receptor [Chitinophaga rhizophila]|uniref:TonB-dependent siderophore receptor n=1 Tax=Chitinophaga rhizophila TaxID=2866212 RepID=A0ABS7G5N9_9BACT|nr:TonB-dependent siderophore receptor [Chitinophaga rhizophila]MBW8682958.1 TonB-dependent siderophore receptor [Chitinophaga rhizophila]